MSYKSDPILCILPPHILESIAANGDEAQRAKALQTIQTSDAIRTSRISAPQMPAPKAPGALAAGTKNRSVFTCNHTSTLPGTLVRAEGAPPSGDVAVDEAYDGAGSTYDLYWDIFQRDSVDGNGLPLSSSVHYQTGYDNAFWDGTQMVYGDGDDNLPVNQRLFNRFTIAVDVIGHELTHGVTQYSANLTYSNQPGALNESISDVFGSLVKQRTLGQTAAQADWLIGQGLFTSNVQGVALRSMKAPGTAYNDPVLGKDPQPANMAQYVNTTQDNGGVHINSGIPNHAFYLIATGIGGNAWEKAGQIWYVTLKTKLQPNSSFQNAADLTFATAGELYGVNSAEQMAVGSGWAGVGIQVSTGPNPNPNPNPGCLGGLLKALGMGGS